MVLQLVLKPISYGVVANQTDDFNNSVLANWDTGSRDPNPPTIASGGPNGSDDRYLRLISSGGSGAGSRLIVFNSQQWTGDYTGQEIASITMDVKNFGTTQLELRLALQGSGGYISSSNSIPLVGGSQWTKIEFPISASDLSGSIDIGNTLSNVRELRILHRTSPGHQGNPIIAELGIDNIHAKGSESGDGNGSSSSDDPDVRLSLEIFTDPISGSVSYRLSSFSPENPELGEFNSLNPKIPLIIGKRYEITIMGEAGFFEFVTTGATPGIDSVILSQSSELNPPLESDSSINWVETANTVSFTVTQALSEALTNNSQNAHGAYRSSHLIDTLRGSVSVSNAPISKTIQPAEFAIQLTQIADGLTAPVVLLSDPLNEKRLLIVEQNGLVKIYDNGQVIETPYLDIQAFLVSPLGILGSFDENDFDERGLLGLAFHPNFENETEIGFAKLYTYTSEPVQVAADFTFFPDTGEIDHQSVLREWTFDHGTGLVDTNSSRVVMRIDQPQFNHNAGHLEFGPDDYLYIALGDGGGANDNGSGHGENGNGQNLNTIHGNILRIDPIDPNAAPISVNRNSANDSYRIPIDNPFLDAEGLDEIYAYGLRNPFKFTFDALGGLLIAADVGQNLVEEINIVQKGENYGWRLKEGAYKFDPDGLIVGDPLEDPSLIDPVIQYDHDDGLSVIGGFVSYGPHEAFWGQYVFGDFSTGFSRPGGRLFISNLFAGTTKELLIGASGERFGKFVKGFGRDISGAIYVLASDALGPYGVTGSVHRIDPLKFNAVLKPADNALGTKGKVSLYLDPTTQSMKYKLVVHGINNATMAHIHLSEIPGADGPPVVWLYPPSPPAQTKAGEFSGVLGSGDITAENFVGDLAGSSLDDLISAIQEERAYVNVHTETSPGGVIRGILRSQLETQPIHAFLNGPSAGSDSSAIGRVVMNVEPDNASVSFSLEVINLNNVTQAHIHVAAEAGGNGDPAVWLYPSAPPTELKDGSFHGILNQGTFSQADLTGQLEGLTIGELLNAIDEGRAYVNVHTEGVASGEIRGWLKR